MHRELHFIHEVLENVCLLQCLTITLKTDKTDFFLEFESPLWAGRLPLRFGEPAGGSLTADEYKFAVTGPWAIIVCLSPHLFCPPDRTIGEIPIIWDKFCREAENEHKRAVAQYKKKKRAWEKAMEEWEEASETDPPVDLNHRSFVCKLERTKISFASQRH